MKTSGDPFAYLLDGDNPLNNSVSLFLLQMALIITISRIIAYFLRKVNQPDVIAEVLAGILLGPTALSRIPSFKNSVIMTSSRTCLLPQIILLLSTIYSASPSSPALYYMSIFKILSLSFRCFLKLRYRN